MIRDPAPHADSPPAQLARRLDRLCDRFEAAWKAGRRPSLERYLSKLPPAAQPNLLGELLVLELEYRVKRGEQPQPEDYRRRFPDHAELIATVFGNVSQVLPSTPHLVRRWTVHRLVNELRVLLFPAAERGARSAERGARDVEESALGTPPAALLFALLDRLLGAGSPSLTGASSSNGIVSTPQPGDSSSDPTMSPTRQRGDGGGSEAARSSLRDTPTQVMQPGMPNGSVSGMENPAGTILGDYEILEQLGKGGMGIVYRARQRSTDRIVALKVIRPDKLEHLSAQECQEWFERFRREGQIAACVEHDNLVAIHEMGHADGRYFYSMRFVEGPSLAEILRTGPLSNDRAARYMEPVARLLHKLHQKGIVHRDLKPKNILIDTKEDRPFVTDFGLAKSPAYAQGLTQVEACMGTPEYISPEQARNSATAREPSDIYSFGATLYELLTGRPPFRAADAWETLRQVREEEPLSPRRLNPAVHRDLELICLKCLQKEPQKRYANALEVAEELRRYRTGQPLRHTRPVGQCERAWRWCRRNPALATASGLAFAALLATAIVSVCFAMHLSGVVRDRRVQSAEFALNNGLGKCAEGKIGEGMLWLARGLELAPDYAKDYDRVVRTNLESWSGNLYPLRAILPQDNQLVAVAVSVDGKTIFTARPNDSQIWDAQKDKPVGPPLVTPASILCGAFSPDGKLLLTGCTDNCARLWEASTGKLIGDPLVHSRQASERVMAVAFSPDGKLAVTGSSDRTAKLWDVTTGVPIGDPLPHKASVLSVCFSPDGKRLLTGTTLPKEKSLASWGVPTIALLGSSMDQGPYVAGSALPAYVVLGEERTSEARLWDATTGRPLSPPLRHRYSVDAVAFSSAGKAIATVTGSTAQIWDLATGKSEAELFPLQNGLSALAFSPDGNTLLAGSLDGTAQQWDIATRKAVGPRLHHRGHVTSVAFDAEGKFLATGSMDKTVRIWEILPPKSRILPLNHGGDHITTAAVTVDGSLLATGSKEGNLQIWEAATGKARDLAPKHEGWIKSIAFSPDGKRLATGAFDEGRLWDLDLGMPKASFRYPNPLLHVVLAVAFSPDGRNLLTGVIDGSVGVWDAAGKPLGRLSGHTEAVHSVAISRNGKLFLTGSEDCSAQVWDAFTRQPIGPPMRQGGPVLTAVFNSDSRFVLTGSINGTAQLWDAITGQEIGPRLDHEAPVPVAAFSPDDSLILTASRDAVFLWETSTGRRRGTPLQHQGAVYSAAFSPDGRLVLTGSEDRTARFWDAATGKQCGPPLQHQAIVQALFSPNGKAALTVGYGEAPRLWDVPTPIQGSVERITLWAKVLTGMNLDETGVVHVLDSAGWEDARRHLVELGGPPIR